MNRSAPVRSFADEQVLIRRARSGDRDAFADLVDSRSPGVLAFLRRMLGDPEDARDVAQLTFVRVWENLHKYDPAWAFSTWLYRIASNLAIDAIRARQSRERTGQENLRLAGGAAGRTEPEGPSALASAEARRIFDTCSAALSEKQRLVFVLREFEEKETSEIAAILDCRESTVRNHLFQARQALREEIRRRCPEYAPACGSDKS
ncbi:MAG: sigma-70 family RNA polymerase sigma factor [Acidobacteria bacterium]|nr:sigma-70 family RNA polymerase sigma factor [Acidobacteriota bacterium]